jgi:hypothetical protein
MKNHARSLFRAPALLAILILNLQLANAFAQGTAFTYQGQLQDNGSLASGTYNLQFTLYTNATGGASVAGPVTNNAVAVTNGLFTVTIDFGSNVWNGETNWLQIGVESNGAATFTNLSPRQELTPVPYAIYAEGGNAAGLSGTIPMSSFSGVYGGAVSLTNTGNSFSGNGGGLTNVNASLLGGLGPTNFWQLGGNNTVAGQFLGTIDGEPLDLYADAIRAMRLILRTDSEGIYTNAPNVVGGASVNLASSSFVGETIGGGGGNNGATDLGNSVSSDFGTISGGAANGVGGDFGTVAGGLENTNNGYEAVISGGYQNLIQTNNTGSTISGGYGNLIQSNNPSIGGTTVNTIGGGYENNIQTDNIGSTIGGGYENQIQSSSFASVVSASTIGGGADNFIQPSVILATIGGGGYNTNGGFYSTVPGGYENYAEGTYSFAAGNRAQALYQGDFVWADSQSTNFAATLQDQVSFRCQGGVLFTSGKSTTDQTVSWTPGSASWTFSSDRNLKDRFEKVDPESVLDKVSQLPIIEWSYKGYPQRHIGAMAQDFHQLFPLNDNDKTLNDADLHGVALAAIQGLNQKVETSNARIQQLEAENDELKERLNALEQIVLKQKPN